MTRILALDLSLTRTGYCVGRGLATRDGGVVNTTKARGMERVDFILRRVQELAKGAGVVVLEGYSYGSQGRAVFDIGELGGCVRLLLYRLHVPCAVVPPATLKKYATGRGNCGKDEMVAAAIRRFGFTGCENNEADAYLLWCMARHAYGHPVCDVPQAQRMAVDKVSWPKIGGEPLAD